MPRYASSVSAMEPTTLVERMRPILDRYPQIAAAWLFGSAARGELRPDSDVDVGILLQDPRATAVDQYELLGELVARLEVVVAPRTVDVVLLEPQGPVFAHEALVDGRLIVEHDRLRRVDFEATTVMRGIDFRPTWELATAGQVAGLRKRLRNLR
jgi:predicted nucleotidyltransferase